VRLTKSQLVISPALMLVLLICLSNCGSSTGISGSQPDSKPDHVQIEIDRHLSTRQNPVVNLTLANMVQQLFATIYALPQLPENIACTQELGPHYTLTLLHISAYEASCVFVARDFDSGQSQYLQADQQFWTLLHQAINQ